MLSKLRTAFSPQHRAGLGPRCTCHCIEGHVSRASGRTSMAVRFTASCADSLGCTQIGLARQTGDCAALMPRCTSDCAALMQRHAGLGPRRACHCTEGPGPCTSGRTGISMRRTAGCA
ncbi:hypothetical protein HAX54_047781, partial [Datura stramonium]|nr:hypothetical protein [Datura stramonium]